MKVYSKIASKYAQLLDGDLVEENSMFANFKPTRGHGSKKLGVGILDSSPMIQSTWTCFRAGWNMRNCHTIFDYLFSNPTSDQRCGRVLSGWSVPDFTGQVGGGVSPSLHSCTGNSRHSFSCLFFG